MGLITPGIYRGCHAPRSHLNLIFQFYSVFPSVILPADNLTRVISPIWGLSRTFFSGVCSRYYVLLYVCVCVFDAFLFVLDAFICVLDSFYVFSMHLMRFRCICMRFSMHSLPDSCSGRGPGPGPQLWTADKQKRVLEKADMLYIRKRKCLSRFKWFPWFPRS